MTVARYPAYKDSGVAWLGEVPAHWNCAAVKKLGRLKAGAGFPYALQGVPDADIEFHKVNALASASTDGVIRPSDNTITSETAQELGAFVFPVNTLAFAKVGAALLLGRVGLLGRPACLDNNLMGLVVDAALHDFRFAWYLLQAVHFDFLANPGAVPSLNESQIGSYLFAQPSRAEQGAIAKFLDRETAKIDALIAEQQRLIELLAEKRQAVISQAVTKGLNPDAPMKDSGIEWLGEVPAHWSIAPLKREWSVTDCKHITAEFVDAGFPLASIREVQGWAVSLDAAKQTTRYYFDQLIEGGRQPKPGDIVFTRNATVGEAAQVPADAPAFAMGQDVCLLRKLDSRSSTSFLLFQLKAASVGVQLSHIMIGSTFKRINVEEVRTLWICVPPTTEQHAIATQLEAEVRQFDDLLREASRAIGLLQERRTALISAAVTGQIDVRPPSPDEIDHRYAL